MAYQEPEIEILSATQTSDAATVTLRFVDWPMYVKRADQALYPLAPAGLYCPPKMGDAIFELHHLIMRQGSVLEFTTFNPNQPLPAAGDLLRFRSWWTYPAMEAVLDRSAKWVERKLPQDLDHEHCLLFWDTIYPGDTAHWNEDHGWITSAAYRDYIERDILRVRSSKSRVEDC